MSRPWLTCLAAAAWLALAGPLAAHAAEGSPEGRFLAGLRQRGLLRLAETYCVERLQRADLPEAQRAELVIELSRCLAEQAVAAPPDAREPLWQRALKVGEEFLQQHPQSPQVLLVRLQGALALLARGELARQEAQLVVDGGPLLEEARTHLRSAIKQLQALEAAIEEQLRRHAPGSRAEPAELSAHRLAALQKNVQYELARALRNQAQCYAGDSPDHANSLTQAVKLLEALAKLEPDDPLHYQSRIDLVVCYRLLSDHQSASRALQVLAEENPPPAVVLRARAEQIRLALDGARVGDALALLPAGRQIEEVTSPELDYAWLEAYLAAWRAASREKDQARLTQWQTKANEIVGTIEALYGPYWKRRAEMLLASCVRAAPEADDLALLVRAAESSFRSGRPEEAVIDYDRAQALAARQGQPDRAFELGFVAATIEHQRNRHAQAVQRYRQLALEFPRNAKAPEAHLLAVYHAAQIAKDQQPASLEQYSALLGEHLKTWTAGPAADEARRRLGRLRQYQHKWSDAIAALQAISPAASQYAEVVEAVEYCCRALLAEKYAAGEPTEALAAKAAEWLESRLLDPQGQLPQRFGPPQRQAALAASRLRLDYTTTGYGRAQEVLSAALRGADDAPAEWKTSAQSLLVFALAGAGRRREAGEVLRQITAGPPEQMLALLEGLARLAATARPEVRRELAALRLQAVDLLRSRPEALSAAQRLALERILAQALADAERTHEAVAAFRALAQAHPQDLALQESLAGLLTSRSDRPSMEAALSHWRELEKKLPQGSPRWLRAQYSIAFLQYRLGNKQQAVLIIKFVGALYPEMGGPELKAKFAELSARCRQ